MKNILILGGTKGVGKEILLSCINKGYNVSFCGRKRDEGEALIKNLGREDQLYFETLDLSIIDNLKFFCKSAIEKFGTIDSVVIYSGITPVASLVDTDESTFDSVFQINLKAPYFLLKYVLKQMKQQGYGSIVFFGSAHMDYGQEDRTAYALTKGALYNLSNHLAHHYAKYGIRSNYVVMGWTRTEGELSLRKKEGISEKMLAEKAKEIIPMGRLLEPNDPVPAVMYLLSDDSKMTTGSIIRITGGEYI